MVAQIVLAAGMLGALFIMFLVLGKSIGSIDNSLYKLEYLVRKECDLKLEGLEMKYKLRAADKKFDEMYNIHHKDGDAANAGGEQKADGGGKQKADGGNG